MTIVPGMCATRDGAGYSRENALGSVGPGWRDLIERLWAAKPEQTIVTQVKEKFGGLRFYVYGSTEAFDRLICEVERQSYEVCEQCGDIGKLDNSGYWVKTLCPVCTAARASERTRS